MEPWQSWLLAIGLGGAAAVYYSQGGAKAKTITARRSSSVTEQAEVAVAPKRKQSKNKNATPNKSILVDSTTSKARQEKAGKGESSHRRGPSVSFDEGANDANQDDKEWAHQLEATRKGLPINSTGPPSVNSKKQGKKNKQISDRTIQEMPATSNVSDMLEPAPAAPSIIRLTGEEKTKKARSPTAPSTQQETKKQRQNRKKAEEKKQQRENDEQERQKLLEKQRRTARESRGEPARNGLGAPQSSNAWSGQPNANGAAASNTASATPLLDTFEPSTQPRSKISEESTSSFAPRNTPLEPGQEVLSEKAQMEVLSEQNGWAEVPSKAKKGKKAKDATDDDLAFPTKAPVSSTALTNGKAENKFTSVSTSELISGQKKRSTTNGYAALGAATEFLPTPKGHPQDSDWAAN